MGTLFPEGELMGSFSRELGREPFLAGRKDRGVAQSV